MKKEGVLAIVILVAFFGGLIFILSSLPETQLAPKDLYAFNEDTGINIKEEDGKHFVDNRILIKFKDYVSEQDSQSILSESNAEIEKEISGIGVRVIRLPENVDELELIKDLNSKEEVEFAEPDYVFTMDLEPNDLEYEDQWSLPLINAPEAWDLETGSDEVIIAVLDKGFNVDHYEVDGKMLPGWDFWDDDSDVTPELIYIEGLGWTGSSHGMLVAGIVAAETDNAFQMSGICWACKILPIKITGFGNEPGDWEWSTATTTSIIVDSLNFATENGARVAVMSYSGHEGPEIQSETLNAGTENFRNSNGGSIFVRSAGNHDYFDEQADDPNTILVSATSQDDGFVDWFSDYGNNIDISAPGINVVGLGYNAGELDAPTKTYDGTSCSAPIVAGVAALVISANPELDADEVEEILEQSAVDLGEPGWDPEFGWGRIDAGAALQMAVDSLLIICDGDLDNNGEVDVADLLVVLGSWGTPNGDVDGDGDTDVSDLLALISNWGPCVEESFAPAEVPEEAKEAIEDYLGKRFYNREFLPKYEAQIAA
jgi:thermitase